jgi:hypothetical protein
MNFMLHILPQNASLGTNTWLATGVLEYESSLRVSLQGVLAIDCLNDPEQCWETHNANQA